MTAQALAEQRRPLRGEMAEALEESGEMSKGM